MTEACLPVMQTVERYAESFGDALSDGFRNSVGSDSTADCFRIDIMIHLGRLRDKSRRVLEISEVGSVVDGKIELHPLFIF